MTPTPSAETAVARDDATRLNILVVDDDATVRAALSTILGDAGHRVTTAANGESALASFADGAVDLVLLDVNMPNIDGFQVAREVRARHGEADWMPIIFLSGETGSDTLVEAIYAGGDDFLVKPVARDVLIAKVYAMQRIARMRKELIEVKTKLEDLNEDLHRMALVDGLTGVNNRRYFDTYLDSEWSRHRRYARPLALILIDVDHFKVYNDGYGHRRGDRCLQQIAALLQRQLQRKTDLVARYGGEEFVIVLPEFTVDAASAFAEQLRRAVCALTIPHEHSPGLPYVTISLGVASLVPSADMPVTLLIDLADQALYHAKELGRNRVVKGSL